MTSLPVEWKRRTSTINGAGDRKSLTLSDLDRKLNLKGGSSNSCHIER